MMAWVAKVANLKTLEFSAPRAIRLAGLALGALALAACATATPYQSVNAQTGDHYGFLDQQIESDRYRISFRGNSLTDRSTVETYLLYRAAELTLTNGYDYFRMIDSDTERNTQYRSTGFGPSGFGSLYSPHYRGFYPSWSYYHPYYGWHSAYDPFWSGRGADLREVNRYEASAEIKLYRGTKPSNDESAFDARQVLQNLEPNILRPVG